jgi:GNAT superfamily N-acetyltransferase
MTRTRWGSDPYYEAAPHDGDAVQALLETDPEFFTDVKGYPIGAEAQSLFTSLPPNVDYSQKGIILQNDGADELVALAELIYGFPQGFELCIGFIFVRKDQRSLGLGSKLLKHLEEIAINRTLTRIVASFERHNGVAAAFFKVAGFDQRIIEPNALLVAKTVEIA